MSQTLSVADVVRGLANEPFNHHWLVVVVVEAIAVQYGLTIRIAEPELPQRLIVHRESLQPAACRRGRSRRLPRASKH